MSLDVRVTDLSLLSLLEYGWHYPISVISRDLQAYMAFFLLHIDLFSRRADHLCSSSILLHIHPATHPNPRGRCPVVLSLRLLLLSIEQDISPVGGVCGFLLCPKATEQRHKWGVYVRVEEWEVLVFWGSSCQGLQIEALLPLTVS